MSLSYVINPEKSHVQVFGAGKVTMPAMIEIIQKVAADSRFSPQFTVIFDLRGVQYTAELADGDALATVLRQRKNNFQNRFAVVVPEHLQVLAKLYCLLANMGGFDKIMPFTDMVKAGEWLSAR